MSSSRPNTPFQATHFSLGRPRKMTSPKQATVSKRDAGRERAGPERPDFGDSPRGGDLLLVDGANRRCRPDRFCLGSSSSGEQRGVLQDRDASQEHGVSSQAMMAESDNAKCSMMKRSYLGLLFVSASADKFILNSYD